LGRALAIPYFNTDQSVELEREMSRIIRVKQAQRKSDMEDGAASALLSRHVEASDVAEVVPHLREIRQQFGARLIRRTPSSCGRDGQPILKLPGIIVVRSLLRMQAWEQEGVAELAHGDAEEARAGYFCDGTVRLQTVVAPGGLAVC
jgi:hypothetical protein